MKDTSMLLLLAILGTGLAVCAADAVRVGRHPVQSPPAADCREIAEVRVLGTGDVVVVVTTSPSGCRNLMRPVSRAL